MAKGPPRRRHGRVPAPQPPGRGPAPAPPWTWARAALDKASRVRRPGLALAPARPWPRARAAAAGPPNPPRTHSTACLTGFGPPAVVLPSRHRRLQRRLLPLGRPALQFFGVDSASDEAVAAGCRPAPFLHRCSPVMRARRCVHPLDCRLPA